MTDGLYTQKYLDTTLRLLADNIDDLEVWDAYNNDLLATEISDLIHAFQTLSKHATMNYTEKHDLHAPDIIVGCHDCFPQGDVEDRNDDSGKDEQSFE